MKYGVEFLLKGVLNKVSSETDIKLSKKPGKVDEFYLGILGDTLSYTEALVIAKYTNISNLFKTILEHELTLSKR